MKWVKSFDLFLEKISRWGIVASLFLILILAVSAIVMRWLGESLMWMEPLTRHIVFMSTFLGGSLATSRNEHIKVDLLTKLIEKSSSRMLHWCHKNIVTLFCFLVCLGLFKSGWDFYLSEKEFGAPSFLNIHSGYLVAIIPAGVGLITLRFLNKLLLSVFRGDVQ
jgi:TRAP-type C4-dicarboxylate transport system permease small subunit